MLDGAIISRSAVKGLIMFYLMTSLFSSLYDRASKLFKEYRSMLLRGLIGAVASSELEAKEKE